ncbi:TPA: hypothetical protein DEO28_03165 [Candidatus Dependentiae bacterium]|nr:MAG: Signal peptidase I [candidate division TM6 bacterium GW2011_GWE2_31_21]KKP53094.1 MAG: Signal peptidase I [candidate division TM6 bacterium GW2011_GWF2_33_332]HBS47912.1 hypothetical protein [Candidatus Dependentiae bacterium]HBZ73484.1 hypothetical protein [Candidatus Dependentiae bacterium]
MNKFKKIFEKWNEKYFSNKSRFTSRIDYWKKHKKEDLISKSSKMIEELDLLSVSLKKDFESLSKITPELKKKVKRFRKVYKELNEITKPEWRQWLEALATALVVIFILRNFVFGLYQVPSGSAEVNLLVGDRVWGNNMAYSFGRKPQRGDLVMFSSQTFKFDQSNKLKYWWQKYVGLPIPIVGLEAGPDNIVKRVVGLPGDTIEGKIENGKTVVYVNGKKLDEPYVNKYPLIVLEKASGFFDFDRIGLLPVPAFLRYRSDPIGYSFDPSKDLLEQPFYRMHSEEVVLKPGSTSAWVLMPFTPTIERNGKNVDIFGPMVVPQGKYWMMGDNRKNSYDSRFWGFLDADRIYGRASFVVYSIDSLESFWFFDFIKHPIDLWTKFIRWNRILKNLKSEPAKMLEPVVMATAK